MESHQAKIKVVVRACSFLYPQGKHLFLYFFPAAGGCPCSLALGPLSSSSRLATLHLADLSAFLTSPCGYSLEQMLRF